VLPQQYSGTEKIKDILSNYYTDGYLPTVMDYFSLITKIDGKAVIPEGDGGTLFDETTRNLNIGRTSTAILFRLIMMNIVQKAEAFMIM
jgi:hypothetical protein